MLAGVSGRNARSQMNGIPRGARLVALLGLLSLAAAPGLAAGAEESLPEFTLATFDGGAVSRATLLGKPALIIFWNTWCPDCMRELPAIDRLSRRLAPQGVAVLAVNTALNDSERKARAYWKKQGYAFPAGFDASFEVGKAFKVLGVPTVLLADAKGVVRYKGARLPEDAEARLLALAPYAGGQ